MKGSKKKNKYTRLAKNIEESTQKHYDECVSWEDRTKRLKKRTTISLALNIICIKSEKILRLTQNGWIFKAGERHLKSQQTIHESGLKILQ